MLTWRNLEVRLKHRERRKHTDWLMIMLKDSVLFTAKTREKVSFSPISRYKRKIMRDFKVSNRIRLKFILFIIIINF